MKSLGKQKVTVETFRDGQKVSVRIETRTVFQKADESYWVTWFAGGHRQVEKKKDGSFHQIVRFGTLEKIDLSAELGLGEGNDDAGK